VRNIGKDSHPKKYSADLMTQSLPVGFSRTTKRCLFPAVNHFID